MLEIVLEKTESLLPAATDPLGIFIKEGIYQVANNLNTPILYDISSQTMPQTCQTQAIQRIVVWFPLNGGSTFLSLSHCRDQVRTSADIFVTQASPLVRSLCWMATNASWETLVTLPVTPYCLALPGMLIFKQVFCHPKKLNQTL